jgi:hypothetical protein
MCLITGIVFFLDFIVLMGRLTRSVILTGIQISTVTYAISEFVSGKRIIKKVLKRNYILGIKRAEEN